MGVFLRKVRTAMVVLAAVIIGGGFATAATSDTSQHDVTYEILSFRALELSSTAPVEFGYVRQGQVVTQPGPILKYATTWAGDKIRVELDADMGFGVVLNLSAGSPTPPAASPSASASIGGPACAGAVDSFEGTAYQDLPLSSSTPQYIIDGIVDCGIGLTGYWIEAPLTFTIDASNATPDDSLMTAGSQSPTVVYTIQAGP